MKWKLYDIAKKLLHAPVLIFDTHQSFEEVTELKIFVLKDFLQIESESDWELDWGNLAGYFGENWVRKLRKINSEGFFWAIQPFDHSNAITKTYSFYSRTTASKL